MKPNQKRKAPSLPYAWGDLQANARGIDKLLFWIVYGMFGLGNRSMVLLST